MGNEVPVYVDAYGMDVERGYDEGVFSLVVLFLIIGARSRLFL